MIIGPSVRALRRKSDGSSPKKNKAAVSDKTFTLDIVAPQGLVRAKIVIHEMQNERNKTIMQQRGIGFSDLGIAIECRGQGQR